MPTSCRHTDTQQLINSSTLRTVTEKGRFPFSSSCRDDIVNRRRLSGASYLSILCPWLYKAGVEHGTVRIGINSRSSAVPVAASVPYVGGRSAATAESILLSFKFSKMISRVVTIVSEMCYRLYIRACHFWARLERRVKVSWQ